MWIAVTLGQILTSWFLSFVHWPGRHEAGKTATRLRLRDGLWRIMLMFYDDSEWFPMSSCACFFLFFEGSWCFVMVFITPSVFFGCCMMFWDAFWWAYDVFTDVVSIQRWVRRRRLTCEQKVFLNNRSSFHPLSMRETSFAIPRRMIFARHGIV